MKVLVVSVHPDDEALGCGGVLLKHKANGDETYCIYVTNGNESQARVIPEINQLFGFKKKFQFEFPELELDDISLNKIIPKFIAVFNEVKPQTLYIPNRSDVHSDHRKTFEAIIATTKSFRFPIIKRVLMCEVISETDFAFPLPENVFSPNVFIDISKEFNKKKEIINVFANELLPYPFTRSIGSIIAHNRYRGSQINVEYAEAFMLLREIL